MLARILYLFIHLFIFLLSEKETQLKTYIKMISKLRHKRKSVALYNLAKDNF